MQLPHWKEVITIVTDYVIQPKLRGWRKIETDTLVIIIFAIIILIIGVCLEIDDILIKRKTNHLIDKVDELSQIAKVKCNLPEEDLPDEYKINYLQKQIDNLALLILNLNYQDKDQTDKPQ